MINSSEKLNVQAYKYLTSLVPLLERTPSRIISKIFQKYFIYHEFLNKFYHYAYHYLIAVNYMQWNLIRNLLPYTESTQMIAVQFAAQFKNEKPEFSKYNFYYNCHYHYYDILLTRK